MSFASKPDASRATTAFIVNALLSTYLPVVGSIAGYSKRSDRVREAAEDERRDGRFITTCAHPPEA